MICKRIAVFDFEICIVAFESRRIDYHGFVGHWTQRIYICMFPGTESRRVLRETMSADNQIIALAISNENHRIFSFLPVPLPLCLLTRSFVCPPLRSFFLLPLSSYLSLILFSLLLFLLLFLSFFSFFFTFHVFPSFEYSSFFRRNRRSMAVDQVD